MNDCCSFFSICCILFLRSFSSCLKVTIQVDTGQYCAPPSCAVLLLNRELNEKYSLFCSLANNIFGYFTKSLISYVSSNTSS